MLHNDVYWNDTWTFWKAFRMTCSMFWPYSPVLVSICLSVFILTTTEYKKCATFVSSEYSVFCGGTDFNLHWWPISPEHYHSSKNISANSFIYLIPAESIVPFLLCVFIEYFYSCHPPLLPLSTLETPWFTSPWYWPINSTQESSYADCFCACIYLAWCSWRNWPGLSDHYLWQRACCQFYQLSHNPLCHNFPLPHFSCSHRDKGWCGLWENWHCE